MKRNVTLIFALFAMILFSANTFAQRNCAANDIHEQQMQTNPKYQQIQQQLENYTQDYVRNFSTLKVNQTRVIPVYVHVIYSKPSENISDAQINSQIDVLNADYGATNSDFSGTPAEFAGVASQGTGIQFVLAGITRKSSTRATWGTTDDMKKSSLGGVDPVTPDTHMNMWVCEIGGGILGYAQFPGGSASTDGVVANPTCFGSVGAVNAPFDKGRTMTHEVGHYLNLRHIWGDGACSATDYVSDTPSAQAANYGTPVHPSASCSSNDMFMNYMDYVDDVAMFMFSAGQEGRMWASLNSTRANLGTSGTPTNVAPTANANGPYTGTANVAVSFSSNGTIDTDGTIASYAWTFGDGATSSLANPTHAYAADGAYNVTLTVTDNQGATGTSNASVQIGTSSCGSTISFSLTTDNYGSETSWTLKNSAGTTIESGSGLTKNTTYNFTWNLTGGNYTFTINDSYGDGICCTYGNGSYSLTDDCGTTIKSGGSFTSSEATAFTISGGAAPVNNAPVANAGGPYSGNANAAISFNGSGTDADGDALTYAWNFGDATTSTAQNPTHTYATAGTYTATLTVSDGTDSGQSTATVTVTTPPAGPVCTQATAISAARRNWNYYTVAIPAGASNLSIDISGGTGDADLYTRFGSQPTTKKYDCRPYKTGNTENCSYASPSTGTYHIGIRAYSAYSGVTLDVCYDAPAVRLGKSVLSFAGTFADNNSELSVYPNPVQNVFTISFDLKEQSTAFIYNINGALVKTVVLSDNQTSVDVSELNTGIYMVKVTGEKGAITERFIKQ